MDPSSTPAVRLTRCAALLAVGLVAGIYLAFTISVMPALSASDDRTFVTAMQNINSAIENPAFALVFVGAFLFTAIAALLELVKGRRRAAAWTAVALVLYTLTLVSTMAVNLPLNAQLAAAGDPGGIADLAAVREEFEGAWVAAHTFRTIVCLLAFACLAWAQSSASGARAQSAAARLEDAAPAR